MEYIHIGKILNTHGVKGELKVEVYTDFVEERFKRDSYIYLGEDHIKVSVKSYRFHNGFMLLLLNDLEDINLVLKYKNQLIYKASEDIKPCDDGYYFRDLKDLDVYVDNNKVGKVLFAQSGTACNYLRVKTNDKEVLVPINSIFIKDVNLKDRRIDVVKMEGLL